MGNCFIFVYKLTFLATSGKIGGELVEFALQLLQTIRKSATLFRLFCSSF